MTGADIFIKHQVLRSQLIVVTEGRDELILAEGSALQIQLKPLELEAELDWNEIDITDLEEMAMEFVL